MVLNSSDNLIVDSLIMRDSEYSVTYVRENNTAALTCPHCGQWRLILADPFRGAKHKLKVKCTCNKIFRVFLEFRRKVRKKTHLRGTYLNHSQKGTKTDIVILDVSVIGLTFSSLYIPSLKEDDKLRIEFTLDDLQQNDVMRDVVVRNVWRKRVGCEFLAPDRSFEGPLGFYVLS